jgi:2-oxoisovalerate dehydrogenase E1 component
LTDDEISDTEGWNNLVGVAHAAVHHGGMSFADVSARFSELEGVAAMAFEAAAGEPGADTKGRVGLELTNSAPFARAEASTVGRVDMKPLAAPALGDSHKTLADSGGGGRRDVMRKHMTKGLDEALENRPEMVYIGEDVEHGGYYVVTEGLKEKYPSRVRDFPPDETTLIGAAIGFSQCGLLPIVEIPYAKVAPPDDQT